MLREDCLPVKENQINVVYMYLKKEDYFISRPTQRPGNHSTAFLQATILSLFAYYNRSR